MSRRHSGGRVRRPPEWIRARRRWFVCSGRGKTFGEQLDLGDAEVDVSRRSAEEADFSDGDRSSWCVLKIDAGELLEFTAHTTSVYGEPSSRGPVECLASSASSSDIPEHWRRQRFSAENDARRLI
jgi:hypothetical protein